MTTQLKVLLDGSSENLRISDELAECFDSGDGGAWMTAFLASPFGTAIWPVEVGPDGGGAFLCQGWPEFVEAHGISVGWFLVLRHVGRGVLTVKAFDGTYLIKEFGQTLTVQIETGRAHRPQFIMPLCPAWMHKMPIPPEFLKRRYISDEELNRRMATFVTPSCGFWHIYLEKDGPNVFFAVEVFGLTGCRRKLEKQGTRFQQTENSEETNSSQETEENEEADSSQETEQREEANPSQKNVHTSEEAQNQKEAHSARKRERNEEQKLPKNSTNYPDRRRVDEIQSRLSTRTQLTTYAKKPHLELFYGTLR